LALFTIAIALKYTSATGTAFFPALNGFLAAFAAWVFLRQPITKATWFAGLLSVVGAAMLIINSPMGGARGALIAFLGGLFFTGYVFLAEHEQKDESEHWPLFGIELLTMAVWANLLVLLFGDWQSVHPSLPKDIWVILYVAGACTFLPTLITVLMQKHISAVTVSFIYILEPVLGAIVSNIYLHETLPLDAYIGGGLIVVGAIVHTWSGAERSAAGRVAQAARQSLPLSEEPVWTALLATTGYALLFLIAGTFILYRLNGFPPRAWDELSYFWPLLPTMMQQGQRTVVFLLVAQSACWLIAWCSLALIAWVAVYRVLRLLFLAKRQKRERKQFWQATGTQQAVQARDEMVAHWYYENTPYNTYPGVYTHQPVEVRER
jgi:drug/metabolite transporter (DMT)-like permease